MRRDPQPGGLMIEFRTLGALDLRRKGGRELDSLLAQPKRIALLTYLCLAKPHGFQRRDTILGLFWPDSDQTRARASLRRALHVLRLSLGDSALQSRGDDEIAVNLDEVWCDVHAFETQLAQNHPLDALELYRGDLLPGFYIDEAPSFERWLSAERTRFRSMAASAAGLAAKSEEARRNFTAAVSWAREAANLSDDEQAVRQLMEVLIRAGDQAGALRVYERFAARLVADLGAQPSIETATIAARLRGKGVSPVLRVDEREAFATQTGDTPPAAATPVDGGRERSGSNRSRLSRLAMGAVALLAVAVAAAPLIRHVIAAPSVELAERRKVTFTGNATQGALSPDGQFLGYVVQALDSNRLVVQDLTGGPADTILTFARATVDPGIEWSPDGGRLLIKESGKVLLIHRRGGRPELLPGFRPGDNARWFPGRSRVSLYNLSVGRLLLINPETGESALVHVAPVPGIVYDAAWSRDGRVFAVANKANDADRWTIRGITLDGRSQVLVEDTVPLNSPRWADGTALYYLRGGDAIWRVEVSAETGRAMAGPEKAEGGVDALPGAAGRVYFSLSRDGHALVYAKGERFSNLFRVYPVDSMTPPRVERLTDGVSSKWSPVVSPDGKWVAFAAQTKDGSEVFRMRPEGGSPVQVTAGARIWPRSEIAWSSDGQRIAFQTIRDGRSQVWVVEVSSGQMRGFPNTSTSTATSHLTWAPGSRITYQAPRTFIRVLDPTTGRDELLVRDTADAWFHYPRYSPDGGRVAMVRYHEPEKSLISILSITDGAETRLTTGLLHPRGWSADGRFIFAQVPLQPKLVRLDAARGTTQLLFTAPAREMECTPEVTRRERSFLCMLFDFRSDIWMIDNFDPRP
jgi:DNA-binding SARP family transcriptional activator/Tol biopolymer transport system component